MLLEVAQLILGLDRPAPLNLVVRGQSRLERRVHGPDSSGLVEIQQILRILEQVYARIAHEVVRIGLGHHAGTAALPDALRLLDQLLHDALRIEEDASLREHRYGRGGVGIAELSPHLLRGIEEELDFHAVYEEGSSLSPRWADHGEQIDVALGKRSAKCVRAGEQDPEQIAAEFALQIRDNRGNDRLWSRYDQSSGISGTSVRS